VNPPPRQPPLHKAAFGWMDLAVAVAFVAIAARFHLHSVVLRTWVGYRAIKDQGYAAARAIFRGLVEDDGRAPCKESDIATT